MKNQISEYVKQNAEKLYLEDVTSNFSDFFKTDLEANLFLKNNTQASEYVKDKFPLDYEQMDFQTIANIYIDVQTKIVFESKINEIASFVIHSLNSK